MRHYGSERSTRPSSSSGDPSSGVGYALSDHEACSHLVESLGEKNWKGKGRDNAGMRIPMDILFLIFVECDVKSLVTCRLVSLPSLFSSGIFDLYKDDILIDD